MQRHPALHIVFLAALCGIVFFFRLGDRGLYTSHEARAAQDGQSILLNDDWLLPQLFDREVELQKPPLYYWLVACFGWLNGGRVDGWCVRLPSACAALGSVLLVYLLCRARGRPLAGLLAACVLATFVHFTWLARVGRIDMLLTFVTTLAVAGFYLGVRRDDWRWLLAGYAALGMGLLLKGPIAVVLPGAILVAMLARRTWSVFLPAPLGGREVGGEGDSEASPLTPTPLPHWGRGDRALRLHAKPQAAFRSIHAFGLWWGIPLVLAIALPWYLAVNDWTRGDFFRVFFWYHNFARGFGGEENLREWPWWFYGQQLAVNLLPWSILLPVAIWASWRWQSARRDALAGLGLCWLVGITLLLSLMRFKRADYLLPAYPGAAVFLGCILEHAWQRARQTLAPRWRRALPAAFALVVAACALGWFVFTIGFADAADHTRPGLHFAEEVRRQTKAVVVLFRVEDHEMTFHLGPPVNTILEWENLDRWLAQAPAVYVIMPADEAAHCSQELHNGCLRPVLASDESNTGSQHRPLVLLQAVR